MVLIVAQARDAAVEISRKTIEAGEELRQEWLIAGGEVTLGAALLQHGHGKRGRETLLCPP